jgi:hypothetical protein
VTVGDTVLLVDVLHRRGEACFSADTPVDLFVPIEQLIVLPD